MTAYNSSHQRVVTMRQHYRNLWGLHVVATEYRWSFHHIFLFFFFIKCKMRDLGELTSLLVVSRWCCTKILGCFHSISNSLEALKSSHHIYIIFDFSVMPYHISTRSLRMYCVWKFSHFSLLKTTTTTKLANLGISLPEKWKNLDFKNELRPNILQGGLQNREIRGLLPMQKDLFCRLIYIWLLLLSWVC